MMARKAARRNKTPPGANASLPEHTVSSALTPSQPLTEHEGRLIAVSVMKKVLVDAKLVGLRESRTMDYDDVWGRIYDILQAGSVHHVVVLLRERFLECLVWLLVDLAPLNQVNCVRVDTFKDSTWFQALQTYEALAGILLHHEGPELDAAHEKWLAHLPELGRILSDHPWISLADGPEDKKRPYNRLRLVILSPIDPPILGERRSAIDFPKTPKTLTSDNLYGLIPLLSRMRTAMISAQPADVMVIDLSARYLAACLQAQEGKLRLKEVAGISFRELLLPCLVVHGAGVIDDMQASWFHPFRLLQLIICTEEGEAHMKTVLLERVISHTSSIVKRAARGSRSRYRRSAHKIPLPHMCDWFDVLVGVWEGIFYRAKAPSLIPARTKFVAEALESKLIFQLEDWSLYATDENLPSLRNTVLDLMEFAATSTRLSDILISQLRIVGRRLSAHSDIRPGLLRFWVELYYTVGGKPSELMRPDDEDEDEDPICGGIGCDDTESTPSRMCGRCKIVYYCSEACQRLDWKRHKHTCMDVV